MRAFILGGAAALALLAGPALADSLNPQPLPPKSGVAIKKSIKSSKGQLNALNPQPQPPAPASSIKAKALASKGKLNALNPQPLPPLPAAKVAKPTN